MKKTFFSFIFSILLNYLFLILMVLLFIPSESEKGLDRSKIKKFSVKLNRIRSRSNIKGKMSLQSNQSKSLPSKTLLESGHTIRKKRMNLSQKKSKVIISDLRISQNSVMEGPKMVKKPKKDKPKGPRFFPILTDKFINKKLMMKSFDVSFENNDEGINSRDKKFYSFIYRSLHQFDTSFHSSLHDFIRKYGERYVRELLINTKLSMLVYFSKDGEVRSVKYLEGVDNGPVNYFADDLVYRFKPRNIPEDLLNSDELLPVSFNLTF